MRLLLIRHGQTPSNVAGALDTGFPGAPLTPLGQEQAAGVVPALVGRDVHGVYASPLIRTQLTAAPLAQDRGVSVEVREGFEEISAGDLEMRTDMASVEAYVESVVAWLQGDLSRRVPGGESGTEFFDRYRSALDGVIDAHDEDATVAVFSHGAAIRTFATLVASPGAPETLRVANTGMVELSLSPRGEFRIEHWREEPLGSGA